MVKMGTEVFRMISFWWSNWQLTTMFAYTYRIKIEHKIQFHRLIAHFNTPKFNKTCRRLIECHLVQQIGAFSFHIMSTLIRTFRLIVDQSFWACFPVYVVSVTMSVLSNDLLACQMLNHSYLFLYISFECLWADWKCVDRAKKKFRLINSKWNCFREMTKKYRNLFHNCDIFFIYDQNAFNAITSLHLA